MEIPFLGTIRSWQIVFLITGLPGIPLALWVLATVREPERLGLISEAADSTLSISSVIDFCRQHWSTYGTLLAGFRYSQCFRSGISDGSRCVFMRTHGMGPGEVGAVVGTAAYGRRNRRRAIRRFWCTC